MALSLNELDADLHLQLGHLHKLMGRLDAAAQFYRQSIAIAGDESPAARELADLAPYAKNELQAVVGGAGDVAREASVRAGEYVDISPETLSDRTGLIEILDLERTQGNPRRAAAICRAIVRLSPLEAEGWTMLAEALAAIEDFDQAVRCRRIADRLGAEAARPVREETADIGFNSRAGTDRSGPGAPPARVIVPPRGGTADAPLT